MLEIFKLQKVDRQLDFIKLQSLKFTLDSDCEVITALQPNFCFTLCKLPNPNINTRLAAGSEVDKKQIRNTYWINVHTVSGGWQSTEIQSIRLTQFCSPSSALQTFIKSQKRHTFSIGSDGRFEHSIYLFIHLIFSSSLQTTYYLFPKHIIDIDPQYIHSAAQQCYCCNMETHADTIKEEHSILDHSMYTS